MRPQVNQKDDMNESVENSVKTTENEMKQVALTFDDGPDPKITLQILETLENLKQKQHFLCWETV